MSGTPKMNFKCCVLWWKSCMAINAPALPPSAAAERCQNQQHYFRHTPAMQFGEGFIRTVDDKGGAVDEDQVII